MTVTMGGRGTGRTTRMLERALKQAYHSPVTVVAADTNHLRILKDMANRLPGMGGQPHPIKFETADEVELRGNRYYLRGAHMPVFVDHYVIEREIDRAQDHLRRLYSLYEQSVS